MKTVALPIWSSYATLLALAVSPALGFGGSEGWRALGMEHADNPKYDSDDSCNNPVINDRRANTVGEKAHGLPEQQDQDKDQDQEATATAAPIWAGAIPAAVGPGLCRHTLLVWTRGRIAEVRGQRAKEPENEQDDKDCSDHEVCSWLAERAAATGTASATTFAVAVTTVAATEASASLAVARTTASAISLLAAVVAASSRAPLARFRAPWSWNQV